MQSTWAGRRASAGRAGWPGGAMKRIAIALVAAASAALVARAQAPKEPDWKALEDETMRDYQALLRRDTRNPPGHEHIVAHYVKRLLEEEGGPAVGIGYRVRDHFADIDAEYCLAEGGGVTRIGGEVKYATVQTLEKIPRGIELVAHGISGHGSIPLKSNAIVHLAGAVAKIGDWRPEVRFNETTGTYFRKLAAISPPEVAKYYRDVLSTDPKVRKAADDWLFENEPRHSSMLRTSVSPNIFTGGYRSNVIPSEAKATLDVRALPDENPAKFLEQVKRVVNDPAVDVRFTGQNERPAGPDARLDSEAYKAIEAAGTKIYNAPTLPMMSTGATDMAQLRARGVQCFGVGPATDMEDGPKGFGAHSDQERLLESELHRFVRFNWEVVTDLARAK